MYFALRMLKSPVFAEDVFQDTFSAVWRNRSFLDPNAPFGPYVYTIMRNRILNMLAEIDKNHQLKEALTSAGISQEIEDTTTYSIISRDLMELLELAIQQLPPQQKKIFCLSREEFLSHKEIADAMNLSVHTVQRHISTTLKTLREILKKHADISVDLALVLFCLNI